MYSCTTLTSVTFEASGDGVGSAGLSSSDALLLFSLPFLLGLPFWAGTENGFGPSLLFGVVELEDASATDDRVDRRALEFAASSESAGSNDDVFL